MSINKDILPPPTFLSYSLGCRTNQAEIENISLQLSAYGFTPYSPPCTSAPLHLCTYPTIVMLNTCVVTQKAEKETRQKIRELRKKFPDSFLVVLGCAVTAKEKFNINIPNADLLISNEEKPNLFNILFDVLQNLSQTKLKPWYKNVDDRLLKLTTFLPNKYQQSGRKFIKIQEGCDRFCSFCLTAYLRGKPQSIPPEKIIEEINFWVQKGIKEIILTGINLSLYVFKRSDLQGGRTSISSLTIKILNETKIERLSFSSIYPEMLLFDRSDLLTGRTCLSLLAVNNPRITQCFHLSLQSGSQSVLERMNRRTDLDKLLEMLKTIKKQNPFFTFRADIIVGFPNETEKEFEETINFIKKAKISFVHSFLFSIRPDTRLEGMIKSGKYHETPSTVKKQRVRILGKVVEKIRNNEARLIIGQLFHCLIVRKRKNHWEGITENGWPILIKTQRSKDAKKQRLKTPLRPSILLGASKGQGKILPIKITGFENNYLIGAEF